MASCSREEPAVPIGHKGIKKRNFFSSYKSKSCSPVRVRGGEKRQIRPVRAPSPSCSRTELESVGPSCLGGEIWWRAGGRQKGPLDLGVARPSLDASREGIWVLAPQEGDCLPL